MQMHFPVDRVMTVVSGVRVENLRNKCRLCMLSDEMQVPNQDNEKPTSREGPVGDRCATVKLKPM